MTCPECQKKKKLIDGLLEHQRKMEERIRQLTAQLKHERENDTYSFRRSHETGG